MRKLICGLSVSVPVAEATSITAVAPAGIVAPFVPVTGLFSVATNLSPGSAVAQTFDPLVSAKPVPVPISALAGAGAAATAGAGFVITGAGAGLFTGACATGRGAWVIGFCVVFVRTGAGSSRRVGAAGWGLGVGAI